MHSRSANIFTGNTHVLRRAYMLRTNARRIVRTRGYGSEKTQACTRIRKMHTRTTSVPPVSVVHVRNNEQIPADGQKHLTSRAQRPAVGG